MKRTIQVGLLALGLLGIAACGAEPAVESPAETSTEPSNEAAREVPAAQEPARAPQYTIEGRVVDPWSDPHPGAKVEVFGMSGEEAGGEAAVGEMTSAADGRFRFELPGAGEWRIVAQDPSMGSARRVVTLTAADSEQKLADLQLVGEGELRGKLLARDGSPISGMEITAYSRELIREMLFQNNEGFDLDALPLWTPETRSLHFEPGAGFHRASQSTGWDGTFVFEGLAPGEYLLQSEAIRPDSWLNPERSWHATGTEDIELRSTLCRLSVSVEGADETGETGWRLGPLEVHPTVPTGDGEPAAVLALQFYARGLDQNERWLETGSYVVKSTTHAPRGVIADSRVREDLVVIGADEARVDFVLEAPDGEQPTGRVMMTCAAPEGFAPPAGYHLRSGLTASAPKRTQIANQPDALFGEWVELPAGPHLATLLPRLDLPGRDEALEYGEAYVQFHVEAGKDVHAELELVRGGLLKVTLDADRFVLGRDLVVPEELLDGERKQVLGAFAVAVGATLALQRDGQGPLQRVRWHDKLRSIGEERQLVLPGESVETYELFAPGEYTLWALRPGSKRASAKVTIRAGETAEAELRLESL